MTWFTGTERDTLMHTNPFKGVVCVWRLIIFAAFTVFCMAVAVGGYALIEIY